MTDCKYYYDFNEIINKNKWQNDISVIECIDNETYYNINLKFNNEQINIITDFPEYSSPVYYKAIKVILMLEIIESTRIDSEVGIDFLKSLQRDYKINKII